MKPRRTLPPRPAAASYRAREEVLRVDYADVLRQAVRNERLEVLRQLRTLGQFGLNR